MIYPTMTYDDPHAAITFLCDAFGFEKVMVVPDDGGGVAHAELRYGDAMIMLGGARADAGGVRSPRSLGGSVYGPYVVVDDPDAHYARAKANGADVVIELHNADYGSRGYSAKDPGGYVWSFGTYVPSLVAAN
jgi:uncharacterized glyoxalase superfamily protein PhnB